MATVETYKTKKPTGLQVERKGNVFTFSWKIKDVDYGSGQRFAYRAAHNGSWRAVTITSKQTSVAITVDLTTISVIEFRVRGKRKSFKKTVKDGVDKNGKEKTKSVSVPTEHSEWAVKEYAWVPTAPTAPTVTYERTAANAGTFTVEHTADTDGTGVSTFLGYQTAVSTSSANPPTNWGDTVMVDATADISRTVTYTEQTETISKTGLVRWFRASIAGPGGTLGWVYEHHAYGKPESPALKSASAREVPERSATVLTAKWTNKPSILKPIDEEIVQYVMGIPTDNSCTPPGTGWKDAISATPSGKKDIVTASVSDLLEDEQCMWMRVVSVHDSDYISYSKVMRVMTKRLKAPDINALPNFTTGVVNITLTINTDCDIARHVIFYRPPKNPKAEKVIGVMDAGVTTATYTVPEIVGTNKSCFGAYAFVGSRNGLSINPIMTSPSATDTDVAAVPPNPITLEKGADGASVFCNLNWRWSGATSMELTWSDRPSAWESNTEPHSYEITSVGATGWFINDLEIGKTWYFRARYHGLSDEDEVTSAWSDVTSIDLATTPETPTLTLNRGFVLKYGTLSASWDYVNEDGSPQDTAQICTASVTEHQIRYGTIIGHAGSGQNMVVEHNWIKGRTYYLCVRVRAESGRYSDWSNPVSVYCPNAPTVGVELQEDGVTVYDVMSKLGSAEIYCEADNSTGRYSLSITRATDYHVDRPDDGIYDGYKGETIWTVSGTYYGGYSRYVHAIELKDLVGALDDGAPYLLTGVLTDDYGQTVKASKKFTVNWAHKASIVRPAVKTDIQRIMTIITPIKPAGWVSGDVFDIYRLTADKPELIVKNGVYGQTYVDPYPGFGAMCGHRVVAKTETGSYISADDTIAWYDLGISEGDYLEDDAIVIDANGMQIRLPYNIELTNRWQKDFKRTSYLGGSVQGDWNPAVLRDLTAKTVIVKRRDTGDLMDMRDLAMYAGPAHIRTPDGSSFACDIQITETASYKDKKVQYSLTVKGIDPAEPDGLTYSEWKAMHPVGG